MKKEKKSAPAPEVLHIPEDEIWTYQIEGLQAPRIGGTYTHSTGKKALVVAVLLVAIGLSIFLSVRAVHKDTFQYKTLDDGTVELVKFSNPGEVTELTVDCMDGDTSKPITALHEYVFNCDEKLLTVTIGKDVREIDGKSFYSCWNLQRILVDEENPAYCDVDGVLFTKDLKTLVCYPIDHDAYLREKCGYETEFFPGDEGWTEQYIADVQTLRLPAETETIGKLACNYSNLADVYMPEGVKTIETMAFFKSTALRAVYTFRGKETYPSLPDGLETIGSDAFSYDQALTYVFIPASVKRIGHHAFWDTVYKESGELAGVTEICVALSEDDFKHAVQTGDQWKPKYDYMLFKKNVDVRYGAERMDADAAA